MSEKELPDPDNADSWLSVETYKYQGHEIEIRSGDIGHDAAFVDGEFVEQAWHDRDHVEQEAEKFADNH